MIRGHLRAPATRRSPSQRLQGKIELVKGLYRFGLAREDVLELLRPLDWLLALPVELELLVRRTRQVTDPDRLRLLQWASIRAESLDAFARQLEV